MKKALIALAVIFGLYFLLKKKSATPAATTGAGPLKSGSLEGGSGTAVNSQAVDQAVNDLAAAAATNQTKSAQLLADAAATDAARIAQDKAANDAALLMKVSQDAQIAKLAQEAQAAEIQGQAEQAALIDAQANYLAIQQKNAEDARQAKLTAEQEAAAAAAAAAAEEILKQAAAERAATIAATNTAASTPALVNTVSVVSPNMQILNDILARKTELLAKYTEVAVQWNIETYYKIMVKYSKWALDAEKNGQKDLAQSDWDVVKGYQILADQYIASIEASKAAQDKLKADSQAVLQYGATTTTTVNWN